VYTRSSYPEVSVVVPEHPSIFTMTNPMWTVSHNC
jgi:hypothetical protein